VKKGFTAKP